MLGWYMYANKKKPKPKLVEDKHSFSIVNSGGEVVARRLRAKEALEKIEALRSAGRKDEYRLVNDAQPRVFDPKKV